ncbi:MAG: hypothetical protein COW24_01030 [Candidatus Kerfeldbacteria bacterium CG15_BIG_FIL_POST_REV_8_21_14_020_45_12]|uniref:Uncharacterized protein n=1 Tax=Candidatus Kerfeldbacteria bacterium CG15_BIG_FIL_POST_REV_8_21_14_020_45_12 TaxID=2014247 RepID=A0A2M7H4W6_9BACT|nr:MAG: hypothetical protein COW24_01030 [Candidatus Kerfeldbacteria bacterium CG15_BIG_FIL_POST_REV_8_21_14_020_45_12]PJA93788.1 MAG: hypothetical protein CO132_01515 [Candidatus Kerfeldbacteria bacterium CG_4_9_14_3_um_filter_45_8]
MIDSVTLRVDDYILYSTEHFTKAKHQELSGKFGVFGVYTTRFTTYAKKCANEGRYYPQVHIMERQTRTKQGMKPKSKYLVIQVSLPKLLFGTNIFDIDERMLPLVYEKLIATLKEIQVEVTLEALKQAVVTRLDYSKILQISASYGSTDKILRALAPYDMKQSSDYNRSHYHDGKDGFYVKYYNSSQGLVIYNKFDEIVANGKTQLEQEIGSMYKRGQWKKGALRIELSLQKKQTVEAIVRKHIKNKRKDYTLSDVHNAKIAKAELLRTYEKVFVTDFSRLVRLSALKDTELTQIIEQYAHGFKERAVLYYLAHEVRKHGLKNTITGLKTEASAATIGRYKKSIESILSKTEAKQDNVNVVNYIHKKLKTFTPILPKKLDALLGEFADSRKNM